MGKKKKNREKSEVSVEAEEEVGRRNFPGQEIFEVFKRYAMAFGNFIRTRFSREREQETGNEEEEKKKKKKKKKRKKKKKNNEKVEVPMEPQEPGQEIHEAHEECEVDARNAILRLLSPEEKEQVEHIEAIMNGQFTREGVCEMYMQCNRDLDLTTQRLLSLGGFEKVKSKRTKKKERINAQESKSQHEVGSSSSVLKQGGSVVDDAGRTDTTHDNTVQDLQEADSKARSQLDNGSSPPAAAVSSVASQLPSINIGKGKGKEVIRSTGDNTAVISRSHVPPLLAVGPSRIHASRAGSDPRVSRNNVVSSSRNYSGKFPAASGGSLTSRNSGERLIRGPRTYASVARVGMPLEQEERLIPRRDACEARPDASNPNSGSSRTLECELLPTSSEPRIHAEESRTQHEVGSSIVKQGGNCDDDAGRIDTTHDDTVEGLQEADGNEISLLDNVSSPPAAAVSSVASQLHSPNIGKGKGEEVVPSMGENTAVISRSHVPPLCAVDPLRLHASSAGSDPRASRNNAASSSRNDWGTLPTELGSSSTTRSWNEDTFSGEGQIWGPWAVFLPPEPQKWEIPHTYAWDAQADACNPNPGSSGTLERELLPTSNEPHGPPYTSSHDCLSQWVARPTEHHPSESPSRNTPSVGPQFELPEISVLESGPSEDTPSNSATSFIHPLREPEPLHLPILDAPLAPSRCGPIQRPATMSENAPPSTPSASIHQSSQTLLRGNNLSTGRGFTHPYMGPSYYQPWLALQYGHMNRDGYVHQNLGYYMTSQQEVYQGGILSQANAGPYSRGSFQGIGRPCYQSPPIPPSYSPGPINITWTCNDSRLHAQYQYRNDHRPLTIHGLATTPHGSFPGQVFLLFTPSSPGPFNILWTSNDSTLHAQYQYRNDHRPLTFHGPATTPHGSFPGQVFLLIPRSSPGPFNFLWTSNDYTLHAQYQYRNDHRPLTIHGLATTPHGSFPRQAFLSANANNRRSGEGSSLQYDNQGGPSWQRPRTRIRPNHQQRSPYNKTAGKLQDQSSMQPPRDPGP
ncbi:uncharacterized protein LOC130139145 [Syzygium oleosum]|uniref:uncharacterized protein LOC130139145 n=1 Tax=Syzygium oleosum TaxID=219896 RepID=UPI0024BB594D|nr:uncharacterized protein LOC130139145 [Syzygium oleosum]